MKAKRFLTNPRLVISGLGILAVMLMAFFAPFLAPYDPLELNTREALKSPTAKHWFGTDEYGRDILSRVIYGAQISLRVAAGAVAFATLFGVIFGMAGGYFGRWVETLTMRMIDVMMCFPPIILGVFVVGFLGPGVRNLILVIGLLYIPRFARIAHSATLSVKGRDFVEASRAIGATNFYIIRKAIFPNILAPIIVQASLSMAAAILLESGLSFLGLGVVPPTPSWGLMIGNGRGYMLINPWYVVWPSLVLVAAILAINTFGDALRDILDPRLRI